eukprot:2477022-Pleurochrysis_carterae.AAC.6
MAPTRSLRLLLRKSFSAVSTSSISSCRICRLGGRMRAGPLDACAATDAPPEAAVKATCGQAVATYMCRET